MVPELLHISRRQAQSSIQSQLLYTFRTALRCISDDTRFFSLTASVCLYLSSCWYRTQTLTSSSQWVGGRVSRTLIRDLRVSFFEAKRVTSYIPTLLDNLRSET